MRKFYSTLKSVVAGALVAAMALASSCSYDDTAIKNDIEQIKEDLTALTERVAALETRLQGEIDAVKALIDGQVVIVDVVTDTEGNQTIKLSNGEDITVLAPVECTCEPAEPCQCDPLEYRVVDGVLEVSADGENWVAINGVTAECVVANVVVEDGVATVTLADGTVFEVAVAELVEFEAAKSAIYVKAAETKSIAFAINDAVEDINVMNQPLGWKASVEAPTRAVGGMDYVLNITAPAKDFVQYAEKSGKVSIHFNTAAGACKVMSVDVELASIDLQVDKAGNITINSTVVDEYDKTDWWGETEHVVEFNNFYIAVFDLDTYYEINGDLESVYNANWGEFNIPAAAGYINNVVTNIGDNSYEEMTYVDGVNEKWTINATVENVLKNLDWYDQLPYEGNSFMVCVIPTDINKNGAPVWAETIAVPFKQLSISIVENVDNRVFNNAYFNVTLRGGSAYYLYPASKADIDMYVNEYQYYASAEEYFWASLESYLQNPDWSSFGFKIESDVVEANISLSNLLAYTRDYYYFETKPATEYIMCLFVEEEGKTEYTIEDLRLIEFATADIVAAETPYEVTWEMAEDWSLFTIGVDVTVPETTNTVYSRWYDEELDEEALLADLINNGYARTEGDFAEDGYTYYLGTYVDAPSTENWLGLLLIDAEGNYTMHNLPFKSKDLVLNAAEVSIEKVEFAEASATITVGGVDGLEVSAYQYYIVSKTSGSSYYQKTEEELADIAYSNNYLYKTTNVNPIVATQTADYKYVFNEGDTYAIAVGVQFADGTFSKPVYKEVVYSAGDDEGDEEVEAEVLEMVVGEGSAVRYTASSSTLRFIDAAKTYCVDLYLYNIVNKDKMYLPVGTYAFGTNYGEMYVYGYSRIYDYAAGSWKYNFDAAVGGMTVSEVNGAYHLEVSGSLNEGAATIEFVYEGAIENLILPSQYKEPEKLDFTPVRAEYDFKFDLYEFNGGDAEYAFWLYDANDNALEVICHYGSHTNWDYQYEATYYGQDGTTFTANKVSTQQPNTYNCEEGQLYFVVTASSTDYEVSYTGQLTATEVNYLGEGSTYPF